MTEKYEDVVKRLEEFSLSDRLLTSGNIPEEHREKYVAAYKGEIAGSDIDLESLLDALRSQNIPLGTVAIRWIEKDGREACW